MVHSSVRVNYSSWLKADLSFAKHQATAETNGQPRRIDRHQPRGHPAADDPVTIDHAGADADFRCLPARAAGDRGGCGAGGHQQSHCAANCAIHVPDCATSAPPRPQKNKGKWCRLQDSNPWPPDYKSGALPTELSRPMVIAAPLASKHAKGPALCLRDCRSHGARVPQFGDLRGGGQPGRG
jgi:hypothetical protein